MKLHLVEIDGDPVVWAQKSQRATVAGFVSVTGILPFFFLVIFPYAFVFQLALINFCLDIYKTKKRANRWVDITRRMRMVITGGYWRVESAHFLRQKKWAWDHFRGRRY
jgi:hypothetical protein